MQYIVCTSDIWWHLIDVKVTYQTAVMDVDKRLKVLYYEMPYIEQEATATRCHTTLPTQLLGQMKAAKYRVKFLMFGS